MIPGSWVGQSIPRLWTSYTPTWTGSGSNPAIVNGTLTGFYIRLGNTIHFETKIIAGASTTFGTGNYSIGLPVAASANHTTGGSPLGAAFVTNAGTNQYGMMARLTTTTTFNLFYANNASNPSLWDGQWGTTTPFSFGNGDLVFACGTYEAA